MRQIRNSFLHGETEQSFEIFNGISETIPNQALPVRDILAKFTRGTLETNIIQPIHYDGLEDFITDPTLSPDFDLADATIFRDKLNNIILERQELERINAEQEKMANAASEEGAT